MNYLLSGGESKERVELLLSLTKINSEPLRNSITDHLCDGYADKYAYSRNGVAQSNFVRAMKTMNKVAGIVEAIKDLDWDKFKSDK